MSDHTLSILQRNLEDVREHIQHACEHAGRSADDVHLVAVTKYADWEWVQALSNLHGICGENRPQQLADRQPQLSDIEWHLIGQLQRNKVRLALRHASLIHSVDSLKLLSRIETVAKDEVIRPAILLQVNVSEEESKSGFTVSELTEGWQSICKQSHAVDIRGLMTMAPASESPEDARPFFRRLRELRDELHQQTPSKNSNVLLTELSMGMSGDFQVAVEEGATLVRIGSRLFQGLK